MQGEIKKDRDYKVFNNIWEKHCFFTDVSTSADNGDIDSISKTFSLKGQFSAKHGGFQMLLQFVTLCMA
jgi:hypothetical protein